jgi:hypothetical protein
MMKTMTKTEEEIRMMNIGDLKIEEPFNSLASAQTDSTVYAYTRTSMYLELNGFDRSDPIVVWRGRNIIVAGQDKYRAALHQGEKEVPVLEKDFDTEDQAIEYLLHLRRNKADWTNADIFIWVEHYDKRGKRGRPKEIVSDETFLPKLPKRIRVPKNDEMSSRFNPGDSGDKFVRDLYRAYRLFYKAKYQIKFKRTSERLAHKLGINDKNQVDKVWFILDHGDEQIKEHVRRGWMTINSAYDKLRGLKTDIVLYHLDFEGIVVRIAVKKDEEVDLESFKWVILGTGDPPDMSQLPGSKIYYRK